MSFQKDPLADIRDLLEPQTPKTFKVRPRNKTADKSPAPKKQPVKVAPQSSKTQTQSTIQTSQQAFINDSSLYDGLHPQLADKAKQLISNLKARGIDADLASGFRTNDQQQKLYANRANNPYPVAKPGTSKHEKRLAFDISPKGQRTQEMWDAIGEEGEKLGLKWGGRFKKFDGVHFELGNVEEPQDKFADIRDLLEPQTDAPQKGTFVAEPAKEVEEEDLSKLEPVTFNQYKGDDLSMYARSAAGAAQWAAGVSPKENNADRLGEPINLSIKTENGKTPTLQEINQAMINQLGQSAIKANERYRQETGHDLITVNVNTTDLQNSFDRETKEYKLQVNPSQESIRIVNAYLKGGLDGARNEAAAIQKERQEFNKEVETKQKERGIKDTLKSGAADAVGAVSQFGYNAATIPEAVFKGEYYGYDSPEYKELEKEDKRNQALLDSARSSIPEETNSVKKVVRGATSGLLQAPLYANPAAPLVAFTANAHKGVQSATGEGVKMALAGGGGNLVGGLTDEASGLVRQVAGRGTQGLINVGGELVSGNTNPTSLTESFIEGAVMPIGKRGKKNNIEPSFGRVSRSIYDPVNVRVPESSFTLSKQMEAMQNGKRSAVLITSGENMPIVPSGYETTKTSQGTFIHDPNKITASQIQGMVKRNTFHRLLGIVENESPKTDRVVIARDKETGKELQAAYVSRKNQYEQIQEFKKQYPGAKIETGTINELESKVLNDRFQDTKNEVSNDESLNLRLEREALENENSIAKLYSKDEALQPLEQDWVRVQTSKGILDVDLTQTERQFGLKNVNDVQRYIKKNGVEPLINAQRFEETTIADSPKSLTQKIVSTAFDIWNIPRAVRASYDLSAAGRQGLLLSVAHPVIALKSSWKQFKSLYKEANYEDFKRELRTNPDFHLAEDSGVYFGTTFEDAANYKREENYQSEIARNIPGVKQSERAYVTYLDNLRLEAFTQYANSLERSGITFENNPKAYKDAARFINFATGRGQGKLADTVAPIGNLFLFSPRNLIAKFQTFNPVEYAKMDSATRALALKDMGKYIAALSTTLTLASLAGADVTLNPDDSDFGKIRVGKTVYDLTAGHSNAARYLIQTISAVKKSINGEKQTLGKKPNEVAARFFRAQLNPSASFSVNTATGKDFVGQDTSATKEAIKLVTPMLLEDLYNAALDDGAKGIVKTSPAVFGFGVQNFDKKKNRKIQNEETNDPLFEIRDLLEPRK